MKKFLFALATSVAFVACNDECDHTIDPIIQTHSVIGSWYEEEANEEIRYSPSGTFYDKYTTKERSGETEGRYEYDSMNSRMTHRYTFMGQSKTDDWKVRELTDYELVLYSSTTGEHRYKKVIETIEFKEYETVDTVAYLNIESAYPDLSIRAYSSSNERIATVSAEGKITAKGEKGTAYIKILTTIGNVWAKVIVGDDCLDLWFDYVSIIDADYNEVKEILGPPNLQGNDGYSFGYKIGTTHDLIDEVDVFLNERTGLVDQIHLIFKSSVPTYLVDNYLKSHYYISSELADYFVWPDFYSTGYSTLTSKAAVGYDKEFNVVVFFSMEGLLLGEEKDDEKDSIEHLWTDYTQDFNKSPSQLKATYGDPCYETDKAMYFYQYDEWMQLVAFSLDANTGEVYSISAFLNSTCDWNKALEFLQQKYYYYEAGSSVEEKWYAFTNKKTLDDSNIGITFDGENGCITYVNLTYNYTRSFSEKRKFHQNEKIPNFPKI